MTKEEYKKLNYYLNMIFKDLEENDKFFLNNLKLIAVTSERFCEFIEEYEFREDRTENNLTFEDVYKISREIIEIINEQYLPIYDKIINDGTLDFNYEKDGSSWCRITSNKILIDIERKFNYDDVRVLIHEFIHYTNSNIDGMTKKK